MKEKIFHWHSNHHSEQREGIINASSKRLAELKLKHIGIHPNKLYRYYHIKKKPFTLSIQDQHFFFSSICELFSAGNSILDCIAVTEETSNSIYIKSLCQRLYQNIKKGVSISTAILNDPAAITQEVVDLIHSGEISGTLDRALKVTTESYDKKLQTRRKVISALSYPSVIFVLSIVVMSVLFMFIIPQFKEVYDSMGEQLPPFTQLLINISDHFGKVVLYIVIFVASTTIVTTNSYKRFIPFRKICQLTIRKLPVISDATLLLSQIKIAFILSSTLSAGISLDRALEHAINGCHNLAHKNKLISILSDIKSGHKISSSLKRMTLFDRRSISQLAIYEKTGRIDSGFDHIYNNLSLKFDTLTDRLKQLLEPFIIVFLGGMIGVFVVGMYLPIFQLGTIF